MQIQCKIFSVSKPENPEITRLEARLLEVEQEFERQMRARGFDPLQHEHVPLTASLARLYNDRESLRIALKSLKEKQ